LKRIYLNVEGRVQGVGFRYYCKEEAAKLNLYGWVKNNSDGSVSLEAQGDVTLLTQFIDLVQIGPSYSRVNKIKSDELPLIDKHEKEFIIKY
jgi:acylphosphatase